MEYTEARTMTVPCSSCGHAIPAGQFRCGNCGAARSSDESDDEGGLDVARVPPVEPARDPAPAAAVRAAASPPTGADDTGPTREILVPRGTFTSEGPEPDTTEAKKERAANPEAAPAAPAQRTSAEAKAGGDPAAKAQSSSQRMRVARCPQRPPYLASEILRDDIAPMEPGKELTSVLLSVSAAAGIAGSVLSGLEHLSAITLALVFAALFALGRLKLNYTRRAAAIAALSGVPLSIVTWSRLRHGVPATELLLIASTTCLPATLHFRAWYRASLAARALVAAALLPAVAWSVLTMHRELLSLQFVWQSWLPALIWYLFVIGCLLSLLAFMGDETTGGCNAWALVLSGWFVLYACLRYALEADAPETVRTLGLAQPTLAAPLSVALAQLLARTLGVRSRRITTPAHSVG